MTVGPANIVAAEWNTPRVDLDRRFEEIMSVGMRNPIGFVVVANGVDRAEADRLRREGHNIVVSRNADGSYRVTRGR